MTRNDRVVAYLEVAISALKHAADLLLEEPTPDPNVATGNSVLAAVGYVNLLLKRLTDENPSPNGESG